MEGTKPKSIFDIPKPIQPEEVKPVKKKRKRSKTPKKKRPKVAKAGGVEISQKKNVKGQNQITLKHKGGLTQEITIYTGDQKPRGVKAKGQTASWNMKPSKFKASRGLRDDRVYLQPPKREYFGNRYKSAIEKIKIDQKIKEAGASKNKEIADVKETANRQKKELERRERAKEDTISELKREKAGIVASYNVSQRNQSRATILGGDVGELNKLINRRGYNAIRNLVLKGEIADASTILQLDLSSSQIDRLLKILEGEVAEYTQGTQVIYITPKGIVEDGKVLNETANFVNLERGRDGVRVKVPKSAIQSGEKVAEARSRSRSRSVRLGGGVPEAEAFSPRPEGSSADERPAHRRDRVRRPRKTGDAPPREKSQPRFVGEADIAAQFAGLESSEDDSPQTKLAKTASVIRETLTRPLPKSQNKTPREFFEGLAKPPPVPAEAKAELEEALAFAEQTSPKPTETTIDEIFQQQPQPEGEESDISSGQTGSGEEFSGREDAPTASGTDLELVLTEPEEDAERRALEAERRAQFLAGGGGGGGTFRKLEKVSTADLQSEVFKLEDGESRFSIAELDALIKAVPDEDVNKPFLVSSFSSFRSKVEALAEEARLRGSGTRSSRTPRPTGTPIGEGRLGSPGLVAARRAQRERLKKEAEEISQPEPQPEPEQLGRAFSAGLAERGEVEFMTAAETKQRTRDRSQIRFVDNRKEKSQGAGRGRKYPVKTLNNKIIAKAINESLKGKARTNLLRKLDEAVEGNGSLFTNNSELLAKIFGS